MKRKRKLKKKVKIFLIVIMLISISSNVIKTTYAKYISETSNEDEIRVAQYGNLKLIEKLNGEQQSNDLDTINEVENSIILGNNIAKEVYIEFTNSEVSTYLFLVIESTNWIYDNELKEFNIINNNTKLLTFNIDSNWIYLDSLSNTNKFIFYYEIDINTNTNTKFDVMNGINTAIIGSNDTEIINNSQIKFNAYSIQKNNNISVEESWNYLNIE